jgi:hypothetical protein
MVWWQRFLDWLRQLFKKRPPAPTGPCIDFSGMAPGLQPNPWTLSTPLGAQVTLLTINPAGSLSPGPAANNRIHAQGGHTGLDCNFTLEIELAAPAAQLRFTLLHSAQPAKFEAFDAAGAVIATGAQSGASNAVTTVQLGAAGIVKAVIHSPANEVLLLELCVS